MITALRRFCNDERGQDLIEYSLLIAFIALAVVQLVITGAKSINGIWSTTNSDLSLANISISGGS